MIARDKSLEQYAKALFLFSDEDSENASYNTHHTFTRDQ